MVSGIYMIINKINGHMYIGGSEDIERRFNDHKQGKNIKTSLIDKAIRKYGEDNFHYQIITELPQDWSIIGEHEKYWINFYNTFHDSKHYNLTEGGEGISGYKHIQETKTKISDSLKGHSVCDETKQKISNKNKGRVAWNKGIPCSEESKRKMSESRKGKNVRENHPAYKDYARVLKMKDNVKQGYSYFIQFYGKKLKQSVSLHKLYKWWGETHPNELLFLEV